MATDALGLSGLELQRCVARRPHKDSPGTVLDPAPHAGCESLLPGVLTEARMPVSEALADILVTFCAIRHLVVRSDAVPTHSSGSQHEL